MEQNPIVVNEDLTNPEASQAIPAKVIPEEVTPPAPGSKTESELLLKSLQEERDKRRIMEEEKKILEEELNNYKSSIPDTDVFSDEGKMLQKQFDNKISSLEVKLAQLEEEKQIDKICLKYPLLREMIDDFKEYRQSEHPKAKIESVAKLFLVEKELYEPERKGLEKTTGGSRSPIPVGMTSEDVETLRKTDYKKYKKLLMEGKLNNIK